MMLLDELQMVFLHVRVKVASLCSSVLTNRTNVRLLAAMYSYVFLHIIHLLAFVFATWALVYFNRDNLLVLTCLFSNINSRIDNCDGS